MRRIREMNINTSDYWDTVYSSQKYLYPGYDFYLTLLYYYIPLLIELKYIDSFEGVSILDYGCGIADRLKLLDISTIKYSGYDISKKVIEYNKSLFSDMNWYSSVNDIQQKPDYIICLHVLEHIDNPCETLKWMLNCAKKGVFIQVPFKQSFKVREHVWEFDETSFDSNKVKPAVIIPGLIMNNTNDREIFFAFLNDRNYNDSKIINIFKGNMSPKAWFFKFVNCGYVNYYNE